MGQAFSLERLRSLDDGSLIHVHDELARRTQVGVNYYLEELARRDARRQANEIARLTRWIRAMTGVITIATLVNVALLLLR